MMKSVLAVILLLAVGNHAFAPTQQRTSSTTALSMGLFDGIAKAFANEEVSLDLSL